MSAASKGRQVRNHWTDHGNGVRSRPMTRPTSDATIERRIQCDTLGLGHWREPADWCREPFSHTVTMVADLMGMMDGWQIYNSGVLVTLTVQPLEGPFVRGAPYVWCKAAHDRNGNSGVYPTAPIFGRFISQTKRGPEVLAGRGKSAVLGAEYVYCFRAVGMVGRGAELYPPRSEIPVPIPSEAERQTQPEQFDVLQHHIKSLDRLICSMDDVLDMTDELDAAEKKGGNVDYQEKAHRQARAFKVLQSMIGDAVRSSGHVEAQLAAYLEASPKLATYLARWQAEG